MGSLGLSDSASGHRAIVAGGAVVNRKDHGAITLLGDGRLTVRNDLLFRKRLKDYPAQPLTLHMEWQWNQQDDFFGYAQAQDVPLELAVLFLSGRLFCYWQHQGDHARLAEAQVYEA